MNSQHCLVLVDGSSFMHRSYHAPDLAHLTTPDGFPTGAIFGVNRMLDQLLRLYPSSHFAVIFDPRGKTRRHNWMPSYKANRKPTPENLSIQFEPLKEVIAARGIPCITEEGEEADDVIGTLTKLGQDHNLPVYIATGDKDLAQLVNTSTRLINTIKNRVEEMDTAKVVQKFGVNPEQIADYLALCGDAVDNIPGVPGVGSKRAAALLKEYDSLSNLQNHLDVFTGKMGENLRNSAKDFDFLRKMTTIICDLPLSYSLEDLTPKQPDIEALKALYRQYHFVASLRALETDQNMHKSPNKHCTIFTPDNVDYWLEQCAGAYWISGVFGSSKQPTNSGQLYALIVGNDSRQGALLLHNETNAKIVVKKLVQKLYKKTTLYCHDCKQILHALGFNPFEQPPLDLLLAAYVTRPKYRDFWSATAGSAPQLKSLWDGILTSAKSNGAANIPVQQWHELAGQLSSALPPLYQQLKEILASMPEQENLLTSLEQPLTTVLWHIERTGVGIDAVMLAQFSKELSTEISTLEANIFDLAGEPFNVDSPKQVATILFERLGLPITKKTSTGEASTNESVLAYLAENGHIISEYILERRQLSKLKSTYTDALPRHIDPSDNRIHCRLNQAVANTGRLSSSDPNLQNIPIRGEHGRRMRAAFIAPPQHSILAADYSQIELRILAHTCDDEHMQQIFAENGDIHQATAAEILHKKTQSVTPDERRYAKTINFGLIYGMGAFSLAKQLHISRNEAETYIARYFERYPKVQAYMEENKQFARQHGYVETLYGRRVFLPDIQSKNAAMRSYAERAAINAPIQGSAADIIKKAMLNVHELTQSAQDIRMILQIHDELLFEVETTAIGRWAEAITIIMESITSLKTPLKVDIGSGKNWAEAH